ncbi:hypothetical protein CB1_000117007 [Camelus ferus]|nr:hypothetical protein CB1_000117007 [Camelus ferus]
MGLSEELEAFSILQKSGKPILEGAALDEAVGKDNLDAKISGLNTRRASCEVVFGYLRNALTHGVVMMLLQSPTGEGRAPPPASDSVLEEGFTRSDQCIYIKTEHSCVWGPEQEAHHQFASVGKSLPLASNTVEFQSRRGCSAAPSQSWQVPRGLQPVPLVFACIATLTQLSALGGGIHLLFAQPSEFKSTSCLEGAPRSRCPEEGFEEAQGEKVQWSQDRKLCCRELALFKGNQDPVWQAQAAPALSKGDLPQNWAAETPVHFRSRALSDCNWFSLTDEGLHLLHVEPDWDCDRETVSQASYACCPRSLGTSSFTRLLP